IRYALVAVENFKGQDVDRRRVDSSARRAPGADRIPTAVFIQQPASLIWRVGSALRNHVAVLFKLPEVFAVPAALVAQEYRAEEGVLPRLPLRATVLIECKRRVVPVVIVNLVRPLRFILVRVPSRQRLNHHAGLLLDLAVAD